MSNKNTKRYMELQMEELKDTYGIEVEESEQVQKKSTAYQEEDKEIADLYTDAWEYEEDIKVFESELEIIKANELSDLVATLNKELPNGEKNYENELKEILEATWTHYVEVDHSHPKDELEIIKSRNFSDIVEKLDQTEIRSVLEKRCQLLIDIKKEHLKEEITEIKTAGLKHHYAKRIYKRYHGID